LLPSVLLHGRLGPCYQLLLTGWLVCEIATAKVPFEKLHAQSPSIQRSLVVEHPSSLAEFDGRYTIERHPTTALIACNGQGWEPITGFAADVVILAIDNPHFVELRVSARRGRFGKVPRADVYRARISNYELPLASIRQEEDDQTIVRFEIPQEIGERRRYEIIFLCFSASYDAEDRTSERFLYQVQWR
jgi:hypothetical protein